jgi:hypothetical protein
MAKRTIKENYMSTITKNKTINLSDQALGAVMLALQNSLMTQTDIVPVLKGFNFIFDDADGLVVINPPILRADSGEEETVPTEG